MNNFVYFLLLKFQLFYSVVVTIFSNSPDVHFHFGLPSVSLSLAFCHLPSHLILHLLFYVSDFYRYYLKVTCVSLNFIDSTWNLFFVRICVVESWHVFVFTLSFPCVTESSLVTFFLLLLLIYESTFLSVFKESSGFVISFRNKIIERFCSQVLLFRWEFITRSYLEPSINMSKMQTFIALLAFLFHSAILFDVLW